jgi:hypothetical protein
MQTCVNLRRLALIALLLALPFVAIAQPRGQDGREQAATLTGLQKLEARYQEINEPELDRPPERDIKIETGSIQKTKLFRADPKLFENKFVAEFALSPRNDSLWRSFRRDPRASSEFPADMGQLVHADNGTTFGSRSASSVFRLLGSGCDSEQQPSELAFLSSAESDRNLSLQIGGAARFTLYAPTADDAKNRALAIIRLYDCGASRPLQRYFLAQGREHLAAARSQAENIAALASQIEAEEKKLSAPSEVSPDILSQLKAQRVMVAVELAGLTARVAACDKMLADPKRLEVSTLQSVSDMKVKAEIERIGTQEKLDRINTFVAEGDRREAIQKNLLLLKGRRDTIYRTVTARLDAAESYLALVQYYAPRDIEANTVTISPVEWTD